MIRVLVTGANGQLGRTLQKIENEYPNMELVFKDAKALDITNKNKVNTIFKSSNFDYCINGAAYTHVEQAEKTPEIAFKVNAEGVANLAGACKAYRVILIHISTDYVFDGEKVGPYTVDDVPNPINEYGKSKWEGEKKVQKILDNFFIVRTSWLYSEFGKNFYKTVLEKAIRGEELHVTDGQIGCPTHADHLATHLLQLITKRDTNYGIHHYTDGEAMSWYEFAQKIIAENKLNSIARVVRDKNYRTFAERPKNSILRPKIWIEMKKAFITGVTGQDGAYLSEFLLKKGYEVHGLKRRSSLFNTDRIDHLYQDPHIDNRNYFLHYGDMTDSTNLIRLIQEIQPDEIYNLAAMSHVQVSFETPEYTANADGIGTLRILDAIRLLGLERKTRIYQASTSELYGKVQEVPQTEKTPFYPRSPYAVAKMYAFWITVNYREAYNMFACNGILFNHESPIRGETFVTRKITRAASKIALGLQDKFYLGNLDAQRDWGHAKDYVRMMWMILQADEAEDWVIASGKTTSVRDFVKMSFAETGIELEFKGKGIKEKAFIKACNNPEYQLPIGKEILNVDPKYFRPTEVDLLIGDASKARNKLGWVPEYNLHTLIEDMMQSDIKLMKKENFLKEGGYKIMNYFE